jgi:hypothetical protein
MTILRWRRVPAAVAGVAISFVFAVACSGPGGGASATSDVSGCAAVLPPGSRRRPRPQDEIDGRRDK